MDGQEKLLDYETIKAAVAGEKWATEKVLAHYADYIDELSTVEIRQPGGKVKKVIDEDALNIFQARKAPLPIYVSSHISLAGVLVFIVGCFPFY